jgi:hypothetical protein
MKTPAASSTKQQEAEAQKKREEIIDFCPSCFGSTDNSSWGSEVFPDYCTNCGHGPPIKLPRWAVEAIRQNASWVGKRYYPHEEDKERHRELLSLRMKMTSFPGRTAERGADKKGWAVTQVTDEECSHGSTTVYYHDVATKKEALEKAKMHLPYVEHPRKKA